MENKKEVAGPVVDFEYIRALNEILNPEFLNKMLQGMRGGGTVDSKDIITFRINKSNCLANLYHDPTSSGIMLLDSIFKMGDRTTLSDSLNKLDIGGSSKTKKGGATSLKKNEIYQVPYEDVEELGGKKKKGKTRVKK